ncbi:MAG: PIN domain-containing protein [Pseudomonadota bacterium]
MSRYLVDTSVWIAGQSPKPTEKSLVLRRLIESGAVACVTGVVIQELLQGTRDEMAFQKMARLLATRPRMESVNAAQLPAEAALLYARCRWQGLTIRKAADCAIARIAIENDAILLHDDADFIHIARIEPRLKLA